MNRSSIGEFGQKLHELLAEAEKLLDAGAAKADGAQDAATDALRRAREHLRAASEEIAGRARAVDRAVHENPWRAIAATGLIAFLLGMLVRRR